MRISSQGLLVNNFVKSRFARKKKLPLTEPLHISRQKNRTYHEPQKYPFKSPSHFKTVYNQEIMIAPLGKILLPMLKLGVGIFANSLFANSLLSLKKESLLGHGHP